jgi:hypothetical protein
MCDAGVRNGHCLGRTAARVGFLIVFWTLRQKSPDIENEAAAPFDFGMNALRHSLANWVPL